MRPQARRAAERVLIPLFLLGAQRRGELPEADVAGAVLMRPSGSRWAVPILRPRES